MDTQQYLPVYNGARLVVVDSGQIAQYDLEQKPQWRLGREDRNIQHVPDVPLHSMIASREHGEFRFQSGQWMYFDNPGNKNGTFYNGYKLPRGLQTAGIVLRDGDVLRVDSATLSCCSNVGVLLLFTTSDIPGRWTALPLPPAGALRIGRGRHCEIVEPYPYISSEHARISAVNGVYVLEDRKSKAGTYLNGSRITRPQPLQEKDRISICDHNYFLVGNQLLFVSRAEEKRLTHATRVSDRRVVLRADIGSKKVKNNAGSGTKELLRDIHLEIREGNLVALLGTAGAGKSTVMNCLNGMDTAGVEGSIVYRGVDLIHNYDQMRSRIGSVPQTKTFHKTFTPEKEFWFAAKKRLPADTTDQEIQQRVDETLRMLNIDGIRRNRISKLSGGEQTRVNVGIELVADRELLCLDEPDQGLDPKTKHVLFEILRDLAHQHDKTIVSIIHDVSEIDMFDQLILLTKVDGVGRQAFSGTPAEARRIFGVEDIRQVYSLVDRNPGQYVR